jgi:hypothetical protein
VAEKQYRKAEAAAAHYLGCFPEDPSIREILAQIHSLEEQGKN